MLHKNTLINRMILIPVLSLALLSGCADGARGSYANNVKTVDQVLNGQTGGEYVSPDRFRQGSAADIPDKPDSETLSGAVNPEENIDIDLTTLSSTMVYSAVFDMVNSPDGYMGQKVRIHGYHTCYEDPMMGTTYHSCLIPDATACCAQGIEFLLTDPYGYPEEGQEMTVTGEFDTYTENGIVYCFLRDAAVSF